MHQIEVDNCIPPYKIYFRALHILSEKYNVETSIILYEYQTQSLRCRGVAGEMGRSAPGGTFRKAVKFHIHLKI